MKLTATDVLKSARERLADPARWLQGTEHEAETADGRPCLPQHPAAVRWDLYGALCAVPGVTNTEVDAALSYLATAAGLDGSGNEGRVFLAVVDWYSNIERTHAEMLAVLDGALVLAAAEAPTP